MPDDAAAIAIAVAVLKPLYGARLIDLERPFTAKLENGQWHVRGFMPAGAIGGVAEIWILKDDGRIVKVTHGQ